MSLSCTKKRNHKVIKALSFLLDKLICFYETTRMKATISLFIMRTLQPNSAAMISLSYTPMLNNTAMCFVLYGPVL